MNLEECALSPEALRWRCDEASLPFRTTDEVEPETNIIGQDRAVEAIQLSLAVRGPGYNAYVAGLSGSGRLTTLRRLLEGLDQDAAALTDKCYVHNFAEPDHPILLRLPAGQGCRLRNDLDGLVRELRTNLPQIFESEDFQSRRKGIAQGGADREGRIFKQFEEELGQHNFQLVRVQMGPYVRPDVVPVHDGKPITFNDLQAKIEEGEAEGVELEAVRKQAAAFHEQLEGVMKEAMQIERETAQKQSELEQEYARRMIGPMVETIATQYEAPEIKAYLEAVRENILLEVDRFRGTDQAQQAMPIPVVSEDTFAQYRVNVLVDNGKATRRPVIVETAPTFQNLFGSLEASMERFGRMTTDHTRIRAGSLVRADGGYLVFDLVDAITEYGVWKMLKRTLVTNQLKIYNESGPSMISVFGLRPEPIPLDVKVCVIGNREVYHLLYEWDDDFRRVFKVKADFDYEMPNTEEQTQRIAGFVKRQLDAEHLQPWAASGVAALVEEAARRSGRQHKLTTRFGSLADLVRETNYFAVQAGNGLVERPHVEQAVAKKVERTNLVETKIREAIEEGLIHIATSGQIVGQVNGLAVYNMGDYQFGKPARVTAKTGVGQSGIINIDREVKLSGPTHDKGMLILQGYMRSMYAQDKPVTLSASLCFEQSYSGIDGDSASSTELYALLSSLSGLPVQQGIAVTGSIDQHGRVQAIGGVNEKIEGFFELCASRGLTGTQGCLIPRSNMRDLMLRHDVVQAVADGQFHIWAIDHVDVGMELLLGRPAGERDAEGRMPEDSVHGRSEAALTRMGDILQQHEHPEADEHDRGHDTGREDTDAEEEEDEEEENGGPVDPTGDRPPGEEGQEATEGDEASQAKGEAR